MPPGRPPWLSRVSFGKLHPGCLIIAEGAVSASAERIIPGAAAMPYVSAKACFKAIHAVKGVTWIGTGRNRPHVISQAPPFPHQLDGLPVNGIRSHQVAPFAGGCSVQVHGLPSRNGDHDSRQNIPAFCGQKKKDLRIFGMLRRGGKKDGKMP